VDRARVLDDLGKGARKLAEAIDWCITNRARDWGDADPGLPGDRPSSISRSAARNLSDGNDVVVGPSPRGARFTLGITVVAAMGNDGQSGFVPSPAAGDGA